MTSPTTSLTEVYKLFLTSSGAQTDSRQLKKNQLFFALKGPNFDGNTYAEQAVLEGANASIVDDPKVAATNKSCYLVDNVLNTLQELAQYHRNQFDIPVVALTGSNGKTTTKELIGTVLKTRYNILATSGNLNNHIGVPLTLLQINANHRLAIIEMGANHLGEIEHLCTIAQPTHGLITNVGKAHLEGFGSEAGVLKAKTELYSFLAQTNGTVFINKEDETLLNALPDTLSIYYTPTAFAVIEHHPTLSLRYNAIEIHTQLAGAYNVANIAAAVNIGLFFDVPLQKCIEAIEAYKPNNHRSQLLVKNNKTIVLDAYNANPSSMLAAVQAFSERNGEKAVILGTMAELGTHEEEEHKTIVNTVKSLGIDRCYWVGNPYKNLVSENWFSTVENLMHHFKINPLKTAQILIKGSRSVSLERLLEVL